MTMAEKCVFVWHSFLVNSFHHLLFHLNINHKYMKVKSRNFHYNMFPFTEQKYYRWKVIWNMFNWFVLHYVRNPIKEHANVANQNALFIMNFYMLCHLFLFFIPLTNRNHSYNKLRKIILIIYWLSIFSVLKECIITVSKIFNIYNIRSMQPLI